MNRIIKVYHLLLFLFLIPITDAMGQKGIGIADSSSMTGIHFPQQAQSDKRNLFVAAAKMVLDMEASKYGISITDVEVFSFPNTAEISQGTVSLKDKLTQSIESSGYQLKASEDDPSYVWLGPGSGKFIMYFKSTRKQSDLYFGRVNDLPPFFVNPENSSDTSSVKNYSEKSSDDKVVSETGHPEEKVNDTKPAGEPVTMTGTSNLPGTLIGRWGNIAGSSVNYELQSAGWVMVAGQNIGSGLELNQDGSFLQTTVVVSDRPDYRIFVSTEGTWTAENDRLIFFPKDRHYRKWENGILMADEHSVPDKYTLLWYIKKNESNGKKCLYTRHDENQKEWEEYCRE